jgi:hypothetical protein
MNLDHHTDLLFANLETNSKPSRNFLTVERNRQNFCKSCLLGCMILDSFQVPLNPEILNTVEAGRNSIL